MPQHSEMSIDKAKCWKRKLRCSLKGSKRRLNYSHVVRVTRHETSRKARTRDLNLNSQGKARGRQQNHLLVNELRSWLHASFWQICFHFPYNVPCPFTPGSDVWCSEPWFRPQTIVRKHEVNRAGTVHLTSGEVLQCAFFLTCSSNSAMWKCSEDEKWKADQNRPRIPNEVLLDKLTGYPRLGGDPKISRAP